MNLLIIEFDHDLRNFMQEILRQHQCQCLQSISEIDPKLKLMDLHYLIIDVDHDTKLTYSYLQRIRQENPTLKILGLSIQNQPELLAQKMLDQLLVKPNILPLLDLAEGKNLQF